MKRLLAISIVFMVAIVAVVGYYYWSYIASPEEQIRRFIRNVPEYGTLPMQESFDRVRRVMRYSAHRPTSIGRAAEASIGPTSFNMDSPWYMLDAIDESEYGQGKYWLTLSIMQPHGVPATKVVERQLGTPQGTATDGAPAWRVKTGALVVESTVPAIKFIPGDSHDTFEASGEARLPSYEQVTLRLRSNGWMPTGEDLAVMWGVYARVWRNRSTSPIQVRLITRETSGELLAVAGSGPREYAADVHRALQAALGRDGLPSPVHEVSSVCSVTPLGNYVLLRQQTDTYDAELWRRVEFRGYPVGAFPCDDRARKAS